MYYFIFVLISLGSITEISVALSVIIIGLGLPNIGIAICQATKAFILILSEIL